MNLDPVVLGKDLILDGSEVGTLRPNDNVIGDGCSGCGKTTSLFLPTISRSFYMNPIASFAKEEEAYMMGHFLATKGFEPWYLNACNPDRSTHSFDPVCYLNSSSDVESFAFAVVLAVLAKTVDSFWNANAIQLFNNIVTAAMMIVKDAGMEDVLELFDLSATPDSAGNGGYSLDDVFRMIEESEPNCEAVIGYKSWRAMPEKTASSIRATLKGAVKAVFPEDVRGLMRDKPQIDFERLGKEKIALIIISDATETWQEYYLNLFWFTGIKELKRVASKSPGHHLHRPIRMYFDDFAVTSPINEIDKNLSLLRSYGISFYILLQGQSQLEAVYGAEKAAIIRQNCPVQLYFPGGFDDKSCELVGKRMNIPYEDVLYSKMGQVFAMISGRKPLIIDRYDTYNSPEYKAYLAANGLKNRSELENGIAFSEHYRN